ncbi:MAG: HepT-like ribonuclease domain-containing protein [Planctomycetota bacterium]
MKIAPAIAARIPEYQNIIGFRHVLVHGYDSLDPMTVWNVIETKLDGFSKKIKPLLDEHE